jgi:prophage DNA circulation protein
MTNLVSGLDQVTAISDSTQGIVDTLGRLINGSYWSHLKPASWRGIPFGTFDTSARIGRRNAVHEYAFRDTPWVEDIGRSARRFVVHGYVVGDDCIARRQAIMDAAEKNGDGELVHPTYGRRQVALLDLALEEKWQEGRVFQFTFTFVEQGQRLFPGAQQSGTDAVAAQTAATNLSSIAAFAKKVLTVVQDGATVLAEATATASSWAKLAISVGNDATSLVKLAVTLPGQFGRLLGLASGISVGEAVALGTGVTLATLTGSASASRQAVAAAADDFVTAAGQISSVSIEPVATTAQALAAAILTASSTPGDALRTLGTLATFVPTDVAVGDQLVVQQAMTDMLHRAALAAMATAGSNYQPESSNDAVAARDQVLAILDAEITVAGDQGEDDVYQQLRYLRAQVVLDLNRRGAQLPTLATVTTAVAMPSLAIAQRLYRDVDRADELVARAGARHPGFMPLTFQALNQ